MARWTDREEWQSLLDGSRCPICRRGRPTDVIAEIEGCWLTMGTGPPAPPLPGTCALFFNRHAVELHELGTEEIMRFMAAVQRVAKALQQVSGAVKINYEVHGNTIPHLHMHLFPRYPGDPFENGPIDPKRPGQADELRRHLHIRRLLVEALKT